MTDVIELRDLRCRAVIGALAEERLRPQVISVDLFVERPFTEAALTDDLTATTNYAQVLELTERVARDGEFLLLETLAYRLAREVLALDEAVSEVTVAVRKVHPPVEQDVGSVGVRTTVRRA
ncbi:MAG: dihydroneopterin aldolase [Acidobacteriota bacterium]|nr:dihydroneopterin aldolase [Acidobacteriota bacterium]